MIRGVFERNSILSIIFSTCGKATRWNISTLCLPFMDFIKSGEAYQNGFHPSPAKYHFLNVVIQYMA